MSTKINSLPFLDLSSLTIESRLLVGVGSDGVSYQTTVGSVFAVLASSATVANPFYETGVFTPGLSCITTGDLTVGYNTREGFYTRIGNTVFVNFRLIATTSFTTAAGNIRITGLPYIVSNTIAPNAVAHPAICVFRGTYTSSLTAFTWATAAGENQAFMRGQAVGSRSNVPISMIGNGNSCEIIAAGFYVRSY